LHFSKLTKTYFYLYDTIWPKTAPFYGYPSCKKLFVVRAKFLDAFCSLNFWIRSYWRLALFALFLIGSALFSDCDWLMLIFSELEMKMGLLETIFFLRSFTFCSYFTETYYLQSICSFFISICMTPSTYLSFILTKLSSLAIKAWVRLPRSSSLSLMLICPM